MPASQIKRLLYRGFNKSLLSSMRKAHPQIVHYHALDRLLFVLVTVFLQGFVICFTSLGRRTEFTPPHRISSTKKKLAATGWQELPVFPIQILLTFGGHCHHYFWGIYTTEHFQVTLF